MPVEPEIDASEVIDRLQGIVAAMPKESYAALRWGFNQIGASFIAKHRKENISGRPGLIPRHGAAGLAGSTQSLVTGDNVDALRLFLFIGGTASKYARIHELGTVGAGGSLPDIVPKKAKWLRFEVGGETVFAKRVAIPPRLNWFGSWENFDQSRTAVLNEVTRRIVAGVAKGLTA